MKKKRPPQRNTDDEVTPVVEKTLCQYCVKEATAVLGSEDGKVRISVCKDHAYNTQDAPNWRFVKQGDPSW